MKALALLTAVAVTLFGEKLTAFAALGLVGTPAFAADIAVKAPLPVPALAKSSPIAAVDVSCAVRFGSGIKCANRDRIKICGLRIAIGNMKLDGARS
jgi:hypothetical protein